LQEVMGLHMADPITGEFSLGAMGFLYENGKFSKPVRGVTIAGTIKDIFKRVIGVGNDVTWSGAMAAPSLLISELAISGT
jgi:PmbA protein